MTVLALDLSAHCGWCIGKPGTVPLVGVWQLPSLVDPGAQFSALCDVLADAITVHQPAKVVIEADIGLHRRNPDATAYQQIGMLAVCELVCWKRDVKMLQATATDARMKMLGRARWPKKGDAKAAVLAWCAEQGMQITNHNVADAYVLWRYAVARGRARVPLFEQAAAA